MVFFIFVMGFFFEEKFNFAKPLISLSVLEDRYCASGGFFLLVSHHDLQLTCGKHAVSLYMPADLVEKRDVQNDMSLPME